MIKKILIGLSMILVPFIAFSQTVNRTNDNNFKGRATFGTGTDTYTPTDTTVWLQVGENNTTKGLLMPRLADTSDYVGSPIAGTIIYQNSDNSVYYYNGIMWLKDGANIDTVQTIAQLESYNRLPNVNLIYVTDSLRGGLFSLQNNSSLVPDSCTIFSSTTSGKYWVRNRDNPNIYLVTWAGASADDPTNGVMNRKAIQWTINAAKTKVTASNFVTVIVPEIVNGAIPFYYIDSTITVPNYVNFICDGHIEYNSYSYSNPPYPAIIIGNNSTEQYGGSYKINVSGNVQISDWRSSTSIGVEFININMANIQIDNASQFNTGLILMGDNNGTSYNNITLGQIKDNVNSIMLSSAGSGWVNENKFFGGNIGIWDGGNQSPFDSIKNRFGIYIESGNHNVFYSPSIELNQPDSQNIICKPLYILNGANNVVYDARAEGDDQINIAIANNSENTYNNFILGDYAPANGSNKGPFQYSDIADSSGTGTNQSINLSASYALAKQTIVYNSGFLPNEVVPYNTSSYSVKGMQFINYNTGALTNYTSNLSTSLNGITLISPISFPFIYVNTKLAKNFDVYTDIDSGQSIYYYIVAFDSLGNVINPYSYKTVYSTPITYMDSTHWGGLKDMYSNNSLYSEENPLPISVAPLVDRIMLIFYPFNNVNLRSIQISSFSGSLGSSYSNNDSSSNIMGLAQSVPTQSYPSGTWIKNDFTGGSNALFWYRNGSNWDSLTNNAAVAPNLHNVLAAGDTATNNILLGGTSRVIWGSTTGGNGGQAQYAGGNFNLSTVSLANPVVIDGSNVAIGSNNTGENVGIGTATPAYKLDVLGNTRLQNNLSIAGDSLSLWNKNYNFSSLGAGGFLRNSTYTSLTNSSSSTFQGDLMNIEGNLEFDNPNSIHLETSGSQGTIAAGNLGFLSLNSSGTSTWIYTDNSSALTGLMGVVRAFNNANYGIVSSITALPAYTFTQGAFTSFTGHIDTLSQILMPSSISGANIENHVGSNYGILQLTNYPNSYNGGTQEPIATSSVGYTVTTANYTVINTAGTNTFTMPAASTCKGQIFHLVCNTGTVTLSIGYLNYAGTNTTSIAAGSGITIQSNGTSYYQIGQ